VRHIPEWLPGGGFKKTAREVDKHVQEIIEKPLAFTIHQRKQNKHVPSFASDLLDENEPHSDVAWTSMGMYIAGADTVCISNSLTPGADLTAHSNNPDRCFAEGLFACHVTLP